MKQVNGKPKRWQWMLAAGLLLAGLVLQLPLISQVLRGRLAPALEADPFAGETVALAEGLSRRCGAVAAVSVLLCAGGNLLQMLLFPWLYSTWFTVSFPVATVLLAAVFRLLCRYFRRAKAVSDDNDSII